DPDFPVRGNDEDGAEAGAGRPGDPFLPQGVHPGGHHSERQPRHRGTGRRRIGRVRGQDRAPGARRPGKLLHPRRPRQACSGGDEPPAEWAATRTQLTFRARAQAAELRAPGGRLADLKRASVWARAAELRYAERAMADEDYAPAELIEAYFER